MLTVYGGAQWYVPLERTAFRDVIAQEVLTAYDGKTETMRNLCRRYGCSTFAHRKRVIKYFAEHD